MTAIAFSAGVFVGLLVGLVVGAITALQDRPDRF